MARTDDWTSKEEDDTDSPVYSDNASDSERKPAARERKKVNFDTVKENTTQHEHNTRLQQHTTAKSAKTSRRNAHGGPEARTRGDPVTNRQGTPEHARLTPFPSQGW